MNQEKKRRETSKVLLWTIVSLSAFFSALSLVLCAAWARDDLSTTVSIVGGVWSAAVIAAIGFYSDKAKAENEIKLQRLLNGPPPELEELRVQNAALEAANKKLKTERDKARKEADQLKTEQTAVARFFEKAQQPGTPGQT